MRVSLLLISALLAGCAGAGVAPSASSPAGGGTSSQTIGFNHEGFVKPDTTVSAEANLGLTSLTDPTYGKLVGYSGKTSDTSVHIITVPTGSTITFKNTDTGHPHTASFLGDASKSGASWPSSFNGSSSQSPANTDISTSGWSTGSMSPGTTSLTYDANVPGFYMIGCAFHYNSNGMRDIVIVGSSLGVHPVK